MEQILKTVRDVGNVCFGVARNLRNYDIEGADSFTNICVPSTYIYSIVCKIMVVCPT